MIKAVLFDIDNTLLDFDAYVKQAMREGFEEFNLIEYDDSMYDTFTRINSGLWHDIEKGKLTFDELLHIRWNRVFEALGITFDGYEFEKHFRGKLFTNAIPVDGAHEILEYLSGRYILATASNGPYEQQINRLRVGDMYDRFLHHFISEKIGASKPSPEFFEYCMNEINKGAEEPIAPYEVMMIGDSLTSDMAGARGFGMKTCYYDRHGKGTDEKVDYKIRELLEIRNIL